MIYAIIPFHRSDAEGLRDKVKTLEIPVYTDEDVARRRFLMVGDSLEHDVSGASAIGFSTVFVQMGIHRSAFANCIAESEVRSVVSELAKRLGTPMPDYTLPELA